jgi:uncharacterized protein (DUF1015 family)
MAEIQAFRGIRYDLGHVGSLSDVIAPPYDVIGPELQTELYEKHPCNVVRLILNRQEPGDSEANNRYTRARRFLRNWQSEGVLFTEADPAIYVYHQEFDAAGRHYVRRGFMARLRLSPFGQGEVFPHEETHSAAKADRLMLLTTCRANLSQIFGLYPDPECAAQTILEEAVAGLTPIEATDHLGVVHRMWTVTDPGIVASVSGVMGRKPVFIADGHHRYETACNYRQHIQDQGGMTPDHPANFVLMMFVAMDEPGLAVLPTHRLFNGVPELTADELAAKLDGSFVCRRAGEGPELATTLWEDLETADDQETVALYTRKDNRWTLAQLTEAGSEQLAEVAADHNEEWRGLGVSILHRLIIEHLLDCTELPKPDYVHLVGEVIDGLTTGEHPLAALVMPATVEHIRQISLRGERMPAKSTYFYPKLLSGLVINPLE